MKQNIVAIGEPKMVWNSAMVLKIELDSVRLDKKEILETKRMIIAQRMFKAVMDAGLLHFDEERTDDGALIITGYLAVSRVMERSEDGTVPG